jgi:hypothetical protein
MNWSFMFKIVGGDSFLRSLANSFLFSFFGRQKQKFEKVPREAVSVVLF